MKRRNQTEKSAEKIIRSAFFKRDPRTCARELIGTELIWANAPASSSRWKRMRQSMMKPRTPFTRPSARSFIGRNEAGAAYVYFNYGVHWMLTYW